MGGIDDTQTLVGTEAINFGLADWLLNAQLPMQTKGTNVMTSVTRDCQTHRARSHRIVTTGMGRSVHDTRNQSLQLQG
jgi:hypothetical protein